MSYLSSVQTRLLATHCCCCGRPLCDAISVEMGIGPECRNHTTAGITEEQRKICNRLTHHASIMAQKGDINAVRQIAKDIETLGLKTLAEKVCKRFVNAERLAKIQITLRNDGMMIVKTPFKRSKADFVQAWRKIPGRVYARSCNLIPQTSKKELWDLLKTYFPGEYGVGPQGPFKIPQ
jgi:hypothetical protein